MPSQQYRMPPQQLRMPSQPIYAPNPMNCNTAQQTNNVNMVNVPPALTQLLQPRTYADDKVGIARTQLERQIFNGMEICYQIDGKLKTLMNSNAYKTVTKLNDIKELYIHLSYLFTYTNGRFQTLQEKCMEDMRRLGFKNDAATLSSGNVVEKYGSDIEDDEEIEIVEPSHTTINLDDSDDERSPRKKTPIKTQSDSIKKSASTKAPEIPKETEKPEEQLLTPMQNENENNEIVDMDIPSSENLSASMENLECDVDISALLQLEVEEEDHLGEAESLLERMNDEVEEIASPPPLENLNNVDINDDMKLNSVAKVILKPVEIEYPDVVEKSLLDINDSNESEIESTPTEQNVSSEENKNDDTQECDQFDKSEAIKSVNNNETITETKLDESINEKSSLDENSESVESKSDTNSNKGNDLSTESNVGSENNENSIKVTAENESEGEHTAENNFDIESSNECASEQHIKIADNTVKSTENSQNEETENIKSVSDVEKMENIKNAKSTECSKTIKESTENQNDENAEENDETRSKALINEKTTDINPVNENVVENMEVDPIIQLVQAELDLLNQAETDATEDIITEVMKCDGQESSNNMLDEIEGTENIDSLLMINDDLENISSPDTFIDYGTNGNSPIPPESNMDALENLINDTDYANIPSELE